MQDDRNDAGRRRSEFEAFLDEAAAGGPALTPFPEPKELVSGFWIIQVGSKEEAIDWASRVPFEDGVIEIRQVFEASDFPADILPPEEAAREQAWRDEQQRNTQQR